jgi:hypothetical protein
MPLRQSEPLLELALLERWHTPQTGFRELTICCWRKWQPRRVPRRPHMLLSCAGADASRAVVADRNPSEDHRPSSEQALGTRKVRHTGWRPWADGRGRHGTRDRRCISAGVRTGAFLRPLVG